MKTVIFRLGAIVLAACVAKITHAAEPALEAHEWGTFTTISGTDGNPLPWWTPSLEGPAALPEFVGPVVNFSKVVQAHTMRMETPVIYFYPTAPLKATVRVRFPGGLLTEAFPAASPSKRLTAKPGDPVTHEWMVNLLPPLGENERLIPPVLARGAHYRHAREVPGAWIVRGDRPLDSSKPDVMQTEKFIFYRGAGAGQFPLRARATDDGVVHIRSLSTASTQAFFVRVRNGVTAWCRASITAQDGAGSGEDEQSLSLPDQAGAPDREESLPAALGRELVAAGLTDDEAKAMVATWNEAWFGEEGTRVLYILPRAWVDEVLPLEITPRPRDLRRVFVARAELFTPAQEQALASVLTGDLPDRERTEKIAALRLGRFTNAGLERAVRFQESLMRERFTRATALADGGNASGRR